MKKAINIIGAVSFLVLFLYSLSFSEDKITITTYYPSPYGSYAELRSNQMSVGSGYRTTAIPSNSLIVQGVVGIGMTSAGSYGGKQTELDVNGEIAANDIWLKDKGRWVGAVGWCKEMSYTLTSGYQECPLGSTYMWFQALYGTDTVSIPTSGSFLCCS